MPEDTPKRSPRKMVLGELAYYESLEEQFRDVEAKNVSKKSKVDILQDQSDRSLSRAIRAAMSPKIRFPAWVEEAEKEMFQKLHAFQNERNAIRSPRWEKELKTKFAKGT